MVNFLSYVERNFVHIVGFAALHFVRFAMQVRKKAPLWQERFGTSYIFCCILSRRGGSLRQREQDFKRKTTILGADGQVAAILAHGVLHAF